MYVFKKHFYYKCCTLACNTGFLRLLHYSGVEWRESTLKSVRCSLTTGPECPDSTDERMIPGAN